MSWRDRVRGQITLVSPDGEIFNAKWIGNPRSASKKLGIFNFPKVDKQSVQDLGISAIEYPLSLLFDGADHDLEASRFFAAINSRGIWSINHPTKGQLNLQPVDFREIIAPVDSASITMMETRWLDVALPASFISSAQISALVLAQNAVVEASALDQMVSIVDQSDVANIQAVKSGTEKGLVVFDQALAPLADQDSSIKARVAAIRQSINETLAEPLLDMTVLGGQIQALVRAPAQITGDVLSILNSYQTFVTGILALPGGVADETTRNLIAIFELFAIAGNSSSNIAASQNEPATRATAITTLNLISDQFNQVTNALDLFQDSYQDQLIEDQYFSQSQSYIDSLTMAAETQDYLLTISFSLSIEKRFTLKEDISPAFIVINELGELGENDSNLDLFIEINQLKNNDILILPVGREVVIYV